MRESKLSLEAITKSFPLAQRGGPGELQVIDGIDLDVAENEFLTVIGPSGCGKTTLLQIIASLVEPDSGHVLVDGEVVSQPSRTGRWCSSRSASSRGRPCSTTCGSRW